MTFPRRDRRSRPLLEGLESRSLLTASGSLDPQFISGQGSSIIPISSAATFPYNSPLPIGKTAEAVQADGKVVVAMRGTSDGTSQTTFLIVRYNVNGTIDTTFGTGGKVVIPFDQSAAASALAVQPDGKIVVGGTLLTATRPGQSGDQYDFAAARLDTDGTLDATFGTGGTVSFAVGGPNNSGFSGVQSTSVVVASVLIQSDDSIVLAGNALDATGKAIDFAAVRLTTSGVLDTSFGTSGTGIALVPVAAPGGYSIVNDIAEGAGLQPDGSIVIGGTVGSGAFGPSPGASNVAVVRLTASGVLDSTFGSTDLPGIAHPFSSTGFPETSDSTVLGLAVQADGKIVLAGQNFPVTRLDVDGSLDPTFGIDGTTSVLYGSSVTIDGSGRIVLLGSGFRLIRISGTTGLVDPSFGDPSSPGQGPSLFTDNLTLAGISTSAALAVAEDGSILVAAGLSYFTSPTATPSYTTGNYLELGQALSTTTTSTPVLQQPPADYDGSGTTNLAVYLPASGSFAYRPAPIESPPLSPPINTPDVIISFGFGGAGKTLPAPGDYDGVGHTEIAAYLTGPGDYAIRDTSTGADRVFQFGSPGLGNTLPAPGDYEGTGKTDVAVYLTGLAAFAILPSDGSPGRIVQLGSPGLGRSIPAPADYFGTGQDDLAVYLENTGAFAVADPTGRTAGQIVPFGTGGQGDIPTPGDFNSAGHVDLAIYVPAYGAFFYRPYGGRSDVEVKLGTAGAGDLPVIGKFDGSALDEFGVYDPATGSFLYQPAGGGADVTVQFGSAGAGQSIPTATPTGALPEFAAPPGPGSGSNSIHILSLATRTATVATPMTSSAVPTGPALPSARVALRPVAQAAPNSLDPTH